jgi:hypothetical protein
MVMSGHPYAVHMTDAHKEFLRALHPNYRPLNLSRIHAHRDQFAIITEKNVLQSNLQFGCACAFGLHNVDIF